VAQPILPYALPLFFCDRVVAVGGGKFDFLGAFHTIRPTEYPFVLRHFSVVAHLAGGLGTMSTNVEIRWAETDELVYTTLPRQITIPNREVLVRLVNTIEGMRFPRPGIYFVELYCENTCIADFRLLLHELGEDWTGGEYGQP